MVWPVSSFTADGQECLYYVYESRRSREQFGSGFTLPGLRWRRFFAQRPGLARRFRQRFFQRRHAPDTSKISRCRRVSARRSPKRSSQNRRTAPAGCRSHCRKRRPTKAPDHSGGTSPSLSQSTQSGHCYHCGHHWHRGVDPVGPDSLPPWLCRSLRRRPDQRVRLRRMEFARR